VRVRDFSPAGPFFSTLLLFLHGASFFLFSLCILSIRHTFLNFQELGISSFQPRSLDPVFRCFLSFCPWCLFSGFASVTHVQETKKADHLVRLRLCLLNKRKIYNESILWNIYFLFFRWVRKRKGKVGPVFFASPFPFLRQPRERTHERNECVPKNKNK